MKEADWYGQGVAWVSKPDSGAARAGAPTAGRPLAGAAVNLVWFGLSWLAGVLAGAVLLIQPIIIAAFGVPFTYQMKRKGVLTSTTPALHYTFLFVLLLGMFALASWAFWYLFPKYIWGYAVGVILTVFPNLGKCGRTDANLADYFQVNARYVDAEALAQFLAERSGAQPPAAGEPSASDDLGG